MELEFEASLVYRVSSRTIRATHHPFSLSLEGPWSDQEGTHTLGKHLMDTRAVLWRPQDKTGGLLSVIHTLSQSRKSLPLEVGPLPRARLQRGHADLSDLFCYLMPW